MHAGSQATPREAASPDASRRTRTVRPELATLAARGQTLWPVPCLIGCLALSAPRLVLLILFLFTEYLQGPFETTFWPFMGFLFLPMTTLGWAASWHIGRGGHESWGVALIFLGLLFDLGIVRLGRGRLRGGGGRRGDPPEDGGGPGGGRPREIVIEAEKVG